MHGQQNVKKKLYSLIFDIFVNYNWVDPRWQ